MVETLLSLGALEFCKGLSVGSLGAFDSFLFRFVVYELPSQDNFHESILSDRVGSWARTQVIKVGSKPLYPLSFSLVQPEWF